LVFVESVVWQPSRESQPPEVRIKQLRASPQEAPDLLLELDHCRIGLGQEHYQLEALQGQLLGLPFAASGNLNQDLKAWEQPAWLPLIQEIVPETEAAPPAEWIQILRQTKQALQGLEGPLLSLKANNKRIEASLSVQRMQLGPLELAGPASLNLAAQPQSFLRGDLQIPELQVKPSAQADSSPEGPYTEFSKPPFYAEAQLEQVRLQFLADAQDSRVTAQLQVADSTLAGRFLGRTHIEFQHNDGVSGGQLQIWPEGQFLQVTLAPYTTKPRLVRFSASVLPQSLISLVAAVFPDIEQVLPIAKAQAWDLEGVAIFAPDLSLSHARVDLSTRSWQLAGHTIQALRATATADQTALKATVHEVILQEGSAEGIWEQAFTDGQYRLRLYGQADPKIANHWIPDAWWHELWETFTWAGPPPVADLDLKGQFGGGRAKKIMHLGVNADDVRYHGAPFTDLEGRLWLGPENLTIYGLTAKAPRGQLAGRLNIRMPRNPERVKQRLRIEAVSSLPLDTLDALSEGALSTVFSEVQPQQPPVVAGRILIDQLLNGENEDHMSLSAQFGAPTVLYGVRFEQLAVDLNREPGLMRIGGLNAVLGAGQLEGAARLQTDAPGLPFEAQAFLNEAKHQAFFAALEGAAPAAPTEAERSRNTPETLSISARVSGQIEDVQSLRGSGKIDLKNAQLARIRLLGGLTRLLEGLSLNLGALDITEARSTYTLTGPTLSFPDLVLPGPTMRVSGQGNLNLKTKALDFTATVSVFGGVTKPIISEILNTLGTLSEALTLRLRGTLDNPEWTTSLLPGGGSTPPATQSAPQKSTQTPRPSAGNRGGR
jgi:hypothetical protein